MNGKAISIFGWMAVLLILSGCVEITDIDLDTAPAKLVVEGKIAENEDMYVLLSLSSSFYATQPHFVEDAIVIISDDAGNTTALQYEGEGRYVANAVSGVPGRKYHLEINYDDQYYEAWTTMPQPPQIDDVSVAYYQESVLRDAGYYATINGIDTNKDSGYYRVLVYRNDKLHNPLGTDDLFVAIKEEEGGGIRQIDVLVPFEAQDKVRIAIIKMDQATYLFYQSYLLLLLNDGGLFGSPPANPESNISNGALGCFQAVTVVEKELIVE